MLQEILLFFAVNFFLVLISFLISFALGFKKGTILVVSVFLIFISLIILFLTVLGGLSLMNAKNYVYAILSTAVLVSILARKHLTDFYHLFNSVKLWFFELSIYKKILCFFILPLIFILAVWAVRLAYTPVWDYDSIAYHMPFVASFLQHQSINKIYFPALSGPIGYYPSNLELLLVHVLLFFRYDSFLNVLNLFFTALFSFAFYLAAREFNAKPRLAILGALALITTPVFLRIIGTLKIDIFFTAIFACATLFLIRYIKQRQLGDLILFSASSGIFFGSRYLAIPYLIVPLALIFFFLTFSFVKFSKKRALFHFAVFILVFLVLGGFWYARNYIVTKNPIFPTHVALGGKIIFQGMAGGFSQELAPTSILNNLDSKQKIYKISGDFLSETGLSIILVLNFFIFVLVAFKTRSEEKISLTDYAKKIFPFAVFLVGLPVYLYFYISSPNTYLHILQNIRYVLPGLFLGILMTTFVASWPQENKMLRSYAMLAFAVIIIFNFVFFDIFPEAQMALGAKPQGQLASRDIFYKTLKNTYYGFWPVLDAMQWADKNLPPDASIGYSGFHFHYPLFGSELTKKINYITPGQCHDCNYYDFRNEGGNIFSNPDYETWLSNIAYYKSDYYVYYNQMGSPESEKNWLREHPEKFDLIYSIDNAFVYKIKS